MSERVRSFGATLGEKPAPVPLHPPQNTDLKRNPDLSVRDIAMMAFKAMWRCVSIRVKGKGKCTAIPLQTWTGL